MTKVLLTGGSGFIAAHILEQLLERGHSVVTTVRSEDKAQKIRDAHKAEADRLQVVIVPELAKEDAFDEVAKIPGLEVVLHTASPFHFKWTDAQTEIVDPAINGTNSILKAVKRSAPTVKRVVITSSFAAILDEAKWSDPSTTFSEKTWNPVTKEEIGRTMQTAYRFSKKIAEKTAWEFVANEKPNFDLVTICPPAVFGPIVHHLASLDSINTSNERVVHCLTGKWKEQIADMGAVSLWIDVRDCAKAHVLAMELPEAGGHRFFTTAGRESNRAIVDVVRAKFPEFADRLPGPEVKGGEIPSPTFNFNNDETNKILGIKYNSFENCITDLVQSLKERGI